MEYDKMAIREVCRDMKKEWLVCNKCSKVDKTEKGYTGTQSHMVCEDCNIDARNIQNLPLAQMCRNCCPTGHGTHFVGE